MSSAISNFGRRVGIQNQDSETLSCSGESYLCQNDPRIYYFLGCLFFVISLGVCYSYTKDFLGWDENWIKLHIGVDVVLLIVCVVLLFAPQWTPKFLLRGNMTKLPQNGSGGKMTMTS